MNTSLLITLVVIVGLAIGDVPDPEKLLGKGVQISGEDLMKVRRHFDRLNVIAREQMGRGGKEREEEKVVKERTIRSGPVSSEPINKETLPYLFQGDILLTPSQAEQLVDNQLGKGIQTDPKAFWDKTKPIPWYFDPSLTESAKGGIKEAIQFWQDNSCLNFTESSTTPQRLRFFKGQGCYSNYGKQYAQEQQDISIGNGCEGFGTCAHEIAHSLGFYHEQSRNDRDDYVKIDFDNIIANLSYNFVKNAADKDNNYNLTYDYGSVMQYNAYAFAVDESKTTTIALEKDYQNALGQRESPSFADVEMLNKAYKCGESCSSSRSATCVHTGFPHPRNCAKCICPRYFGGDDCSSVAKGNAPICNGAEYTATDTWQSFDGKVGQDNLTPQVKPVDCFWKIAAPSGKQLQLKITATPASCVDGCNWQGMDVNLGKFDMYGMMICCPTDRVYNATADGIIAIRGISRYSITTFSMQYRFV